MLSHPVARLRLVSVPEAVSFLLLLAATAVKYGAHQPLGVRILGPVHGLLFILYVLSVLEVRSALGWTGRRTVLVMLAGAVPVAPLFVERGLRREQLAAV